MNIRIQPTLDEALRVFFPPEPVVEPAEEDDEKDDFSSHPLNDRRLQRVCAEALLDNRVEDMENTATALSEGLREALENADGEAGEDQLQCDDGG